MILALRGFLDSLAGGRPDAATMQAITGALSEFSSRLEGFTVTEDDQVYGRRVDLVGRGQATWPAIRFTQSDETCLQGNVTFGRYFLGRNGVAHGGAILFSFDEMAGRLANLGNRTIARTAFVRTDFRAPAPIDTELQISSRFVREEGRKRFVRIELHHGEQLCAEAEVLMVALLQGQQ